MTNTMSQQLFLHQKNKMGQRNNREDKNGFQNCIITCYMGHYVNQQIKQNYINIIQNKFVNLMESQLQTLRKQRMQQYKEQLLSQASKLNKEKVYNQSYMKKKSQLNQNQLVQKLKTNDDFRAKERRDVMAYVKDSNSEMRDMKKSMSSIQNQQQKRYLGKSFMDHLNEQHRHRYTEKVHDLKDRASANKKFEELKRNQEGQVKSVEKLQEKKHLERVIELDELRRKNYSNNLKKHTQNMSIYDRHNKLIKDNESFKKYMQKFTDTPQDILHNLRRNQAHERRKMNRTNQQEVLKQIQKKNNISEIHEEATDIKKSLFRGLVREYPDRRRDYAYDLQKQMSQFDFKKNQARKDYLQKNKIQGVIGGEYGPELINQIRYVDKKLGIKHERNSVNKSQQLQIYHDKPEKQKNPSSRGNKSETSQRPLSNVQSVNKAKKEIPSTNYKMQQSDEQKGGIFRSYNFITGKTRFIGS